jgi:hypothetical protein
VILLIFSRGENAEDVEVFKSFFSFCDEPNENVRACGRPGSAMDGSLLC